MKDAHAPSTSPATLLNHKTQNIQRKSSKNSDNGIKFYVFNNNNNNSNRNGM